VQPGETLGGIAACHRTSVDTLARANQIRRPDRIQAGAVLRVPAEPACVGANAAAGALAPRGHELPASAGPALARAERLLSEAETRYDAADFEQALGLAETCLQALRPHPDATDADPLRARCHVVSGMAAAGLERPERAVDEFQDALGLAPDLTLDPERSSPRVVELMDAARARSGKSGSASEQFVHSSTE
jgi:LysM repeat protein